MDKSEEMVKIIRDFNEAFNRHDVTGMMQFMTDDCLFENTDPAPDGSAHQGKATVTRFWRDFFLQSSRAHIEIEEIFAAGEHCVMRWVYSWVDETSQAGHVRGVDIFRLRDGMISEKRSYVKG